MSRVHWQLRCQMRQLGEGREPRGGLLDQLLEAYICLAVLLCELSELPRDLFEGGLRA